MEFEQLLAKRRSYRVIKPAKIDRDIVEYLAEAARLAPSCFNNQPWQYVFVTSPDKLKELQAAYSQGNEWAHNGSLVIAVFSKKEDDCIVADRRYYLFDTGISAGFLMLAAADLDLTAHPIAGYSQKKAKSILNIPAEMKLITFIVVGEQDKQQLENLPEEERKSEIERPPRKKLNDFIHFNSYERR